MPSATDVKIGWMDWPCPYKRISKFNNPISESLEEDGPLEDVVDVGSKTDTPAVKKHAACDECRLFPLSFFCPFILPTVPNLPL
jgi:hypothetical protein